MRRVKSLESVCSEFSPKVLACLARLLPVDLACVEFIGNCRHLLSGLTTKFARRSDRVFQWWVRGTVRQSRSRSHMRTEKLHRRTAGGLGFGAAGAAGAGGARVGGPRNTKASRKVEKQCSEGAQGPDKESESQIPRSCLESERVFPGDLQQARATVIEPGNLASAMLNIAWLPSSSYSCPAPLHMPVSDPGRHRKVSDLLRMWEERIQKQAVFFESCKVPASHAYTV